MLAVVGNPRPESRTHALAAALTASLAAEVGGIPGIVDLSEAPPGDRGLAISTLPAVEGAGVVIAASPTYKAAYTGLLKLFLDGLPGGALAGKVAIPLMVAGSPRHAMAADLHLRPVLIELGASCPSPALVALESELAELGPEGLVTAWMERADEWLGLVSAPRAAARGGSGA